MPKLLVIGMVATLAATHVPAQHFDVPIAQVPVPEADVPVYEALIAKIDAGDIEPGDGEIDEAIHKVFPIKADFFFIHLRENVSLDMKATLKLVDAPA